MEHSQLIETLLKSITRVPFGQISSTVYRHGGKTTSLAVHEYENHRFDDNVAMTEWLLNGLKAIADRKDSGEVVLRIKVANGKFKLVTEERKLLLPNTKEVSYDK